MLWGDYDYEPVQIIPSWLSKSNFQQKWLPNDYQK